MVNSSSSTLVNVAEDAELRLARILADTAASCSPTFVQDCEACIVERDAVTLLKTMISDAGAIQALFVLEPLEEAVSAFSLIAALLDRVKEDRPEEEAGLAKSLQDVIVNAQVVHPSQSVDVRRIALLSALYNLRSDGREKCHLLATMIRLAAAHQPSLLTEGHMLGNLILQDTHTTSALQPSVPSLVEMLDHWNVEMKDRRDLLQAISESLVDSPTRKQRFVLLLVESYTDASQVDALGLSAAKDAAVGAIRDPVTLFAQQRSVLNMPAIVALASNNDTKILHGLLTIFQEGKLDEYETFVKENGGESVVLAPYGLDSNECIRHMRILSLCSLATEHEEIPYATVAQTLQLPSEDDVESWVIAAVSSGLLAAKMDQLERKVIVERSVVRRFDMEQWKSLQTRLNLWKHNIRGVLEGFKQGQLGTN